MKMKAGRVVSRQLLVGSKWIPAAGLYTKAVKAVSVN